MNGNKIPTALQDKQQWVCHNAAQIPLQPNGNPARTYEPTTGSSYQDVCEALIQNKSSQNPASMGFVFTEADDLTGRRTPVVSPNDTYLVFAYQRLGKTVAHNGLPKINTIKTLKRRYNDTK